MQDKRKDRVPMGESATEKARKRRWQGTLKEAEGLPENILQQETQQNQIFRPNDHYILCFSIKMGA